MSGVEIGFYSGRPEEFQAQAVAELCIAAGADADRVAQWVEEGWHRAKAARPPPFSQPGRTPPQRS